jgi:hypothetical protein
MGNKTSKTIQDEGYDHYSYIPHLTLEQIRKPALDKIKKCRQKAINYIEQSDNLYNILDEAKTNITESQFNRIKVNYYDTIVENKAIKFMTDVNKNENIIILNIFNYNNIKVQPLSALEKKINETCNEEELKKNVKKLPPYLNYILQIEETLLSNIDIIKNLIKLYIQLNNLPEPKPKTIDNAYILAKIARTLDGDTFFEGFLIESTEERAELRKKISLIYLGKYTEIKIFPANNAFHKFFDPECIFSNQITDT